LISPIRMSAAVEKRSILERMAVENCTT